MPTNPFPVTAFSLVKLLVAGSIALVVLGAIPQLFSMFGRTMSQSQATVNLSGRIRTTAWQLRQDPSGVTAELVSWNQPESDSGYFGLLEGPARDASLAIVNGAVTANLTADTDDSLFLTTRSAGDPFVGQFGTGTIEALCTEVAWFYRAAGDQPIAGTLPVATYDTWGSHSELNGANEDGDGKIDEGTDGIDDNGNSLSDSPPESETSPPYPVRLRALEVRIRCCEPTLKQVRQITVRHKFLKNRV